MNIRTSVTLSIVAVAACLVQTVAVGAQSTRLSRPSNHMQQGGVDYSDDVTPPPALNNRLQQGTMDNTMLQSGANQGGLRGGAMDNGRLNNPMSAGADMSAPIQRLLNGGTRQLSGSDLANLSHHDIVLLIDRSSSMAEMDCPSIEHRDWAISRWNWCREQTSDLAQQTAAALPQGISVLLFSWGTRIFPHVDMKAISQIFTENHPDGITNEAAALGAVFDDYFTRRSAQKGKVAPLLVAVITDGRPTSETAVAQRIIEATRNMKSPDEIKVTFLLIGQDNKGMQFIQDMDQGLVSEGAKFDIVSCKPFPELVQTGLASSLADCISQAPGPAIVDAFGTGKHKKH